MTSEIDKLKHFHIGNCPNCIFNKKVLAKVIRESNICKHAIKELKLAGYGKGEG